MLDFEVQRFTRKCSQTDEVLQPGATFYSALVAQGSAVVRKDYAEKSWRGPPEGVVGWWKSQVPDVHAPKMHWAPNDVIVHYFEQLEGDEVQADLRYVLALLMIRRRIVRLEETRLDEQRGEVMVMYCPRNEREYEVAVVSPTERRVREIQQEIAALLFGGTA
jgi:hypothetical protein